VTNGEYTYDHILQYFPNFLKGKVTNWFVKYEILHPVTTWDEVQWAFINQFSGIHSEG
jgi:hypothetical protein